MADDKHDDLVRDLVRDLVLLAQTVDRPASHERLATAVMDRVANLPSPGPTGERPPLRMRIADLLESRRRRVALVVAAVLLALLATPPVRAAIADWFGFGGVVVERGSPAPGPAAGPPEVVEGRSAAEAADAVDFPAWAPAQLGAPDGAGVSADGRVVAMSWSDTGDGVIRLDQFDGRFDWAFAKRAPDVSYANVDGTDALWFERPHEVVVLGPDGSRRTESARLAGHTLIWVAGATTLRLEGDLSLERAVEIAESAAPVG